MSSRSKMTLGQLIEFQRGYDLPKSEFIDGVFPVISSNGILGYHNEYKVKGPGITIGRSGTVGLPHYIENDFFPHNTALFIKDFKGNHPKYIYYLLKTLGLNDRKSGSGVPTMNRNHLHPLSIFAHKNINDQQKIASVLSALDSKIELNNRINTELEAMVKTLYDYWFVQFDFSDKDGKPYKTSGGKMVWNEELKREIPDGWQSGSFGKYAKLKGGFAFKSSWWTEIGLPVIKIKDINENYTLSIENCSCVGVDKYDKAKNYEAFPGDVVIAMTGATVGKFGIVPKINNSILVNQRVGLFNLGSNPMLKLPFLINSLNQNYFRETVFVIASGAAQPNISSDQIDAIPLVIPEMEIIDLFNLKFSYCYTNILNNMKENQTLAELRDWLLPMLMNGQVQVMPSPSITNDEL